MRPQSSKLSDTSLLMKITSSNFCNIFISVLCIVVNEGKWCKGRSNGVYGRFSGKAVMYLRARYSDILSADEIDEIDIFSADDRDIFSAKIVRYVKLIIILAYRARLYP